MTLGMKDINRKIDFLLTRKSPAQAIQYAKDAAHAVPLKEGMWKMIQEELETRYPQT